MGEVVMVFSIIIPVYNAEKYLERCIESIVKQSFSSYEIILIDDGSTDSSKALEDIFLKKMNNLRVFSSPHVGAPAARNIGIRNSMAEYIVFVDADDTLEVGLLEQIYNIIRNIKVDVCYANQHYVIESGNKSVNVVFDDKKKRNYFKREEFLTLISEENNRIPGSMWLMAVNRSFVIENNLYMDQNIIWSEDTDFALNLCTKANIIGVIYFAGYDYYLDNAGSLSKKVTIRAVNSRLDVYRKWYEFFVSNGNQMLARKCIKEYCNYLKQVGTFDNKKLNKELKERLKSEKFLWVKNTDRDVNIYKVFGLNVGSLYNCFMNYKYKCVIRIRNWRKNV
jgi:glycosyltransferase involved in cell wall biosynthesis